MANPVVDEPIAALYDATTKLGAALAAGSAASESAAFEHLVAASSSASDAVRQLCADSLPTFFHHFPAHADAALSAYFDLLEDGNATVRLHALRGLPTLAKHNPSLVPRLADVLAQLLVTEEAHELQAVLTSLSSLFSLQHRACFAALVSQLEAATDDRLREKAADFLLAQLSKHWKQMTAASVSAEEQAEYAAGIKTVLGSVDSLSPKQSRFLLSHLLQLRVVKDDPNVKQDVAAIITARARLDKDFQPSNAHAVEAFISGLRAVNEYKKYDVDANAFLQYFQSRVLPVLHSVPEEQRLQLVRALANQTVVDPQSARALLAAVWEASKPYLPLVKSDTAAKAAESSSGGGGVSFRFQLLESLLAVLHHLAAATPDGAREVLGLFVSTGQPADARVEAKRQETLQRLGTAQAAAAEWSSGQPAVLAEEKRKLKAATDAEAKKASGRLISQLSREQQAAAALPSLCKPLLAKTPTFLPAAPVSWRRTADKDSKAVKGGEKRAKAEEKQQSGKKQKTSGAESAAAVQKGGGKKEKGGGGGGGGGGQQRQSAKAGGASTSAAGQSGADGAGEERRKGREQQRRASAGAAGGGGAQTQQSARSKKRKSAPASSQQPPQQQQGGSGKRSRTGAAASGGQQQQAALSAQQMAAASVFYNQMMAQAMAAQAQQQAMGMQQQQLMQQQQQRAGGGSSSRKRGRARK